MAENVRGQNRTNQENIDQQRSGSMENMDNRSMDNNQQEDVSLNGDKISDQGTQAVGGMRDYSTRRRGSGLGPKTNRTGSDSDGQPSHDQL